MTIKQLKTLLDDYSDNIEVLIKVNDVNIGIQIEDTETHYNRNGGWHNQFVLLIPQDELILKDNL